MLQTKTLVSILVVAIVAIGGYFVIASDQTQVELADNTSGQNNEATETASNTNDKKMAFAEFIKQGGSYKCTVNQSVGGIDTTGTTYLSNGMIRGEYATQAQGLNIETTLIVRDGYTHTWTSMVPNMGFKSRVIDQAKDDATTGTSSSYSFDAEKIGDYSCDPWVADMAMFQLPAGVTFSEI